MSRYYSQYFTNKPQNSVKGYFFIILVLLFAGCSNSNTRNTEQTLPPPPDTSKKYEIHYNGKIMLLTDSERERFLDSLNIKDTIVRHLE